ncbi:MAG: hypothetical protein K2I75_06450 [Clostridiales bacterium]|nr:hypothetical protein [Clostridiales bacterium]
MTFEEIYNEFKAIDPAAYRRELESKSMSVLPALISISGNERVGARFLATFVLGAALSDGELDKHEYDMLEPMFYTFFGDEVSFAESKILAKNMVAGGNALPDKVDEMIDFFGRLSEKLKADLVLICLMICAVDGDVSQNEKDWIARLVA